MLKYVGKATLLALVIASSPVQAESGPWAFMHGHGGRDILILGDRANNINFGFQGTTWGCGPGARYNIIRNFLRSVGPTSDVRWHIQTTCPSPEGRIFKVCVTGSHGLEACSSYLLTLTQPMQ